MTRKDSSIDMLSVPLTWVFLLLGEYTMIFEILPKWFMSNNTITPWGYLWFSLFQLFFLNAMVSHVKATLMEPGYTPWLPVPVDIPMERIRYCEKCDQWKPDRTHHCSACNRCIHRMDHHCPWINNCVGAKNQKFFILFLFYVFLCCFLVFSLILYIIVDYFTLKNSRWEHGVVTLVVGVISGVIASVFMIFTAVMFCDQVEVIVSNQTEVERLGKRHGVRKTRMECLRLALGDSVVSWVNPFQDSPEPDYGEVLYFESKKSKNQKELDKSE